MVISLTPTAFALAAKNRGLRRSFADVILFNPNGIALRKGGEEVRKWAWEEVRVLRYRNFKRQATGMLMALGGGMLGGREASFTIAGPEDKLEVALEIDAQYRGGELRSLFKALYLAGAPLKETTSDGLGAFLLAPLRGRSLEECLAGLRAEE